jgi:hypothetical protein
MTNGIEIWMQRGTKSENKAGFVVTGTSDTGDNLLSG